MLINVNVDNGFFHETTDNINRVRSCNYKMIFWCDARKIVLKVITV